MKNIPTPGLELHAMNAVGTMNEDRDWKLEWNSIQFSIYFFSNQIAFIA